MPASILAYRARHFGLLALCFVRARAYTPEPISFFGSQGDTLASEYVAHGGLQSYDGIPAWTQSIANQVVLPIVAEHDLLSMPNVTLGALYGGRGAPWEPTNETRQLLGNTCNFEIVDLQGGGQEMGEAFWEKVASVVRAQKPALFVNMYYDGSGTTTNPEAGAQNRELWSRKMLARIWSGIHNMSVMTFAPMEQFGKGFRISTTMEAVTEQLPASVDDISAYNIENEYMWDPNALSLYGDTIEGYFPNATMAVDTLFNDTTRYLQVQRQLAWRILGQESGSGLTPNAMKQADKLMSKKQKGADILYKTSFIDRSALRGEREARAAAYDHDQLRCVPSIIGFGPSGIGLPFHVHDEVPYNLQVWGHKRWFISKGTPPRGYNPKKNSYRWLVEEYPKLTSEQRDPVQSGLYECTVRPGEAVYVPRDFYHQTMNIGVQLNVAFACPAANREENILYTSALSRSRFTANAKDSVQGDPRAAQQGELDGVWSDAAKYFKINPKDEGVLREVGTVGIGSAHYAYRRIRRAFIDLARLGAQELQDIGLGQAVILNYDPMEELAPFGAGAVYRRAEELGDILEVGFFREERVSAALEWSSAVLSGLNGTADAIADEQINGTWADGQQQNTDTKGASGGSDGDENDNDADADADADVGKDGNGLDGVKSIDIASSSAEIGAIPNVSSSVSEGGGISNQTESKTMPLPQEAAEVRARRHLARVIHGAGLVALRETLIKSQRLILRSAKGNPINPQAWRNLVIAELLLGNTTRAVKSARRAMELDRSDVTTCNRAVMAALAAVDATLEPPAVVMMPDFSLATPKDAARAADSAERPTVGGGRTTNDAGRRRDDAGLGADVLRAADALAHGCVDYAQVVMRQRLAGQIDALWFGQLARATRMLRYFAARGLGSHESVTAAFYESVREHMSSIGVGTDEYASKAADTISKQDASLSDEDKATARRLRGHPIVTAWGDSLLEHGEMDWLGQPPQEKGVRTLQELWRQRTTQVQVAKLERLFLHVFEGTRETMAERCQRLTGAAHPSSLVPHVKVIAPSPAAVKNALSGHRRSYLLEMIRAGVDLEDDSDSEGDSEEAAMRDGYAVMGGGDMPDAWNPDALQRIQEEMQADYDKDKKERTDGDEDAGHSSTAEAKAA